MFPKPKYLDFLTGPSQEQIFALQGLCSAVGDPPGNPAPPLPPNGGFSQEQLDLLDTKFGVMVNSAITSRDKRFEKQLGEKFDALMEKLAAPAAKPKVVDPDADPDDPPGKGKSKDIMLASIQRQLEEMKQRAEAADQLAQQERSKNRDIERRRIVGESLQAIGVTDPVRQRHAIAYLDSEKRVTYRDDESDELVWHDGASEMAFAVGLRSWARTDDAKHFMNPTNARGSGSNPGKGGPSGAPLTEQQILARLDDALRQNI